MKDTPHILSDYKKLCQAILDGKRPLKDWWKWFREYKLREGKP